MSKRERLTQTQEPVAWMCMVGKGDVWEVDLVTEHRGVVQEWERESHGIERGMARVIPLVPVGASPVASAPCREDEAQAAGMMAATHDAHSQLADVAGRMKVYGYDAETLRVLTEHIFGGAEIPMPASAPEEERETRAKIADELQEAAPIYMRDDEASTLGWVLDWLRATQREGGEADG